MVASTSTELASLSSTQVVVHPLVLLSVSDHVARAAKGTKKRVVGILLGQDNSSAKGNINVSNSFAVPFEEDERDPRTWFLDHNYIESMNDMFKKVNARERLIGWYHSGPRLRSSDLEINEVVKRYCSRPVLVIVDVAKRDTGLPTDAYFAVEEIKDVRKSSPRSSADGETRAQDGTATQKTFMHVPSSIEAEEAEEIGVEHLLRDIKDLNTGTLSTRVAEQIASLRGLHSRLTEIADYLGQVVRGELEPNHQILYNLQDVFNLLPNLEAAERTGVGKTSFTVATNDQLLVLYLSSLIRAVIALHNLVDNKLQLSAPEQKEEESKSPEETAKADTKPDAGSKEESKK